MAHVLRLRRGLRSGRAVVVYGLGLTLASALVFSSVSLLLSSPLSGQTTHDATVRKFEELQRVCVVIAILEQPIQAEPGTVTDDLRLFQEKARQATEFLKEYRAFHAATVAAALDPDDGAQEAGLLVKLDAGLGRLEAVLARFSGPRADRLAGQGPLLPRNDPEVRKAFDATRLVAEHLRLALVDDIRVSVERANARTRPRAGAIVAACVWTGATVLGLLYFVRPRVSAPTKATPGPVAGPPGELVLA